VKVKMEKAIITKCRHWSEGRREERELLKEGG